MFINAVDLMLHYCIWPIWKNTHTQRERERESGR